MGAEQSSVDVLRLVAFSYAEGPTRGVSPFRRSGPSLHCPLTASGRYKLLPLAGGTAGAAGSDGGPPVTPVVDPVPAHGPSTTNPDLVFDRREALTVRRVVTVFPRSPHDSSYFIFSLSFFPL